ncbi:hypothetical protein RBG61_09505 [Paludicola sp. MB14-C6]|uniref:hypothetical protein n=1 Tax=Paludihabitans sp. MB14-C6 TaxID=3070656 RepID=UPI0027DE66BD|nr:hypothetical protein [Paludicola sp. MB14-C6]WMJ22223.1 hypothetical protein RBG61_09505 [Paludicola sp. MB14-C6]
MSCKPFEPTTNIYRCGCDFGIGCNCGSCCPCPCPSPCPPPCPFPPHDCKPDYSLRNGNDAETPQSLPAAVAANTPDLASSLALPIDIQTRGNDIIYNPTSKNYILDDGYYLVVLRTIAVAPLVTGTVVYAGATLSLNGIPVKESYTASASGFGVSKEIFMNQLLYVPSHGSILTFYNNTKAQPIGTGSAGNTVQYFNTTVDIVKLA